MAPRKKYGHIPEYMPTPEQIAAECELIRAENDRNNAHQDTSEWFDNSPGIREINYWHTLTGGRKPDRYLQTEELEDSQYWNQEIE